jgi:hypothetical protein
MKYHGIYPGQVVNNIDTHRSMRLQVRVNQIHGSPSSPHKILDTQLPWAEPCVPFTGKNSGFGMVPEKDAAVWVMFYMGDVRHPIWIGGWYPANTRIEEHAEGYSPAPTRYIIETPKGNRLELSDDNKNLRVTLEDAAGQHLLLDATGKRIVLKGVGDQVETFPGHSEKTVSGNATETILGNKTQTSGMETLISAGSNLNLSAAVSMVLSAAALLTLTSLAALMITAVGAITITAGAALTITAVGTLQILATNLVLGNASKALKVCNEKFMELYNTHTHTYIAPEHPAGSVLTTIPTDLGVVDTHTTENVRCS